CAWTRSPTAREKSMSCWRCSLLDAAAFALRRNVAALAAALCFVAGTAAAEVRAPLADAAEQRDWTRVRTLVREHADVNAAPAVVTALLGHGARLDARDDRRGQTALMWAAAEGHAAIVHDFIEAGADFRLRTPSGFSPLLFAAREGRMDVVRVLLEAGADV